MGDTFATIEGLDGVPDTGDLPLVHVEIRVDRFGGEERTATSGALCELFEPFFERRIDADGKCSG
jgi:hypothetical protein